MDNRIVARLKKMAEYNPFNDLKKVKENGDVTDGWGNEYNIPNTGYSKVYKVDKYKFRYNFSNKTLEILDKNEVLDSINLNATEWVDNPEAWAHNYLDSYMN